MEFWSLRKPQLPQIIYLKIWQTNAYTNLTNILAPQGLISTFESLYKNNYSENSEMSCLKKQNLRIKVLIPNVMQLVHKIEEKIDQRLKIYSLRGIILIYIT